MTTFIYVFIVMAIVMGLFCMFVTARDVVIEEKERREKKRNKACERAEVNEELTVEEPVFEEENDVMEEVVPTTATDETAVMFSKATQTLEEKYLELSSEYKAYYDKIVKCAMAVEGSKRFKNESYEEYKVGKNRLVRLKIRRGIVVCELVIPNLTFKTYVADKKVAMKQAPAKIKVMDETSLTAVEDSINIAVKAIEEEKAYKKEQAKLRRKQRRENAREKADGAKN